MTEKTNPPLQTKTAFNESRFLEERDVKIDDQLVHTIGPTLCTFLNRLLKVVGMFKGDHEQVNVAAKEMVSWLGPQFDRFGEDSFHLQFTETNFFLNGQLLKFDQRAFVRNSKLKDAFLGWSVNQITLNNGVGAGEIVALGIAIGEIARGQSLTLETFRQPHLLLETVAEQELDLPEVDERREIIELYAGLMVKTSIYFDRVKRGNAPSARFLKRIIQKISDQIRDHGYVFTGLINLKLIVGADFTHATNTAIYAMLLADAIKLDRLDVVRCGMTALTQNIERFRQVTADVSDFETGDETHFNTNLASVAVLSEMGANDVMSALRLVTSYERGFPFNKPLPPAWYREDLRPHLLSRIIEIASHYDTYTTGMKAVQAKSPDLALQSMMGKMGTHYDPNLLRIFVNVIGIYPVGCAVELSTGDRALVIRSPALIGDLGVSNANRPTIKMLDGSERILDLSQPQNSGLRIQRILELKELERQPGVMFLF